MQALRWALRSNQARLLRAVGSGEALIREPCVCARCWASAARRGHGASTSATLASCRQCPICQRWTLDARWCSECGSTFCRACCGWPPRTYCPRCTGRRVRYASLAARLAAVALSLEQVLRDPQIDARRCHCGRWYLAHSACRHGLEEFLPLQKKQL